MKHYTNIHGSQRMSVSYFALLLLHHSKFEILGFCKMSPQLSDGFNTDIHGPLRMNPKEFGDPHQQVKVFTYPVNYLDKYSLTLKNGIHPSKKKL